MTDRETTILNHPNAKHTPRLAAYLANETTLPSIIAIQAMSLRRDLPDDGSAGTSAEHEDADTTHFDKLNHTAIFNARRAQTAAARGQE